MAASKNAPSQVWLLFSDDGRLIDTFVSEEMASTYASRGRLVPYVQASTLLQRLQQLARQLGPLAPV